MKYLFFYCHEEKKFDSMPKSEGDALMNETLTYCEKLKRSGHLIVATPLEPIQIAVTVRVRNGGLSLTDGPFAETKEQIGGFFLIEARDINEAVQIASRFPSVRLGSIEVRPVRELPRQETEGEPYQNE